MRGFQKIAIEIPKLLNAEEDFDSIETLDNYLIKCFRMIGSTNISFFPNGVLCPIFTNRGLGRFDVDLSKITIKGRPLSSFDYQQLKFGKYAPSTKDGSFTTEKCCSVLSGD